MELKKKGFSGWLVVFALAVGLIAGYLAGLTRSRETKEGVVTQKIAPSEQAEIQAQGATPPTDSSAVKKETQMEEALKVLPMPLPHQETCLQMRKEISEYFDYIAKKDYFKQMSLGTDPKERLKAVIERLTARPPIPGGEGSDPSILLNNIYYLFRTLDKGDLRLLKEFLTAEGEDLELELALLYRWAMTGEKCGDDGISRPSFDLLYLMSGFFLNTIGGRAYLLRRPAPLRTIISYYCVSVLHEANLRGKNFYGIDIVPHLKNIKEDLSNTRNLLLKEEYNKQVSAMERHYSAKR